jgi:peptidoglycan hydrolase-like protein with peptidoglycan-binding domain
VETLEQSLAAAGYEPGEVDETFDSDTRSALEAWQADNGFEATGIFQVAGFLWAPTDSVSLDVMVNPGDIVQPGQAVAMAGPSTGDVVRVSVDQADVTSIEAGDEVRIDIDGLDESITGSVVSVSQLPTDGTDFEVMVSIEQIDGLRSGMEGTVAIVVDTLDDVVLIPTGALGGTASAPTVEVLFDGAAETRSIVTGLTTPTHVEVVTGVAAGDQIVIGEVTE